MGLIDKFRDRGNIDISQRLPSSDSRPGVLTVEKFGRPSPCPSCGSAGYLDHLDLIDRIQYQHCPSCEHRWEMYEEGAAAAS